MKTQTIRTRQQEKCNDLLPMALAAGIGILDLIVCVLHHADISETLLTGVAGSLMLLFGYASWRNFLRASTVIISILEGTAALLALLAGAHWLDMEYKAYGALTVLLMLGPVYAVWAAHKLLSGRIRNKVWLGIASCIPWLVIMIGLYWKAGMLPTEDMGLLVLWLAECIIMAAAWNRDKKAQWRAWLACLVLLFVVCAVDYNADWKWMAGVYWQKAAVACAPFLYLLFFRHLARGKTDGKSLLTVKYFSVCGIFYILVNGFMYGPNEDAGWRPELYLYLMLVSTLVFAVERRRLPDSARQKGVDMPVGIAYTIGCFILTVAGNMRLREIIYYCGGPAVGIDIGKQVDWIGYRLAAVKTFFTGDLAILEEACRNSQSDSYAFFEYSKSLTALVFRTGPWLLLVFAVMVSALSVLLLRRSWGSPEVNRLKNYFAVSCILRMAISAAAQIFMFQTSFFSIPFTLENMMDFALLWLLWSENRRSIGKRHMREGLGRDDD